MEVKSKEDRLKETIVLLKKLPEVGVPTSSYVYEQVKKEMTNWVSDGPVFDERFDFGTHWGDLKLPIKPAQVASLNLVAKRK